MAVSKRSQPNILISGTPGTGKSTLAKQVAEKTGLSYVSVGDVAKENNLFTDYDEKYDCYNLDEERLLDELEDVMDPGGNIVDYHSSDFFPERWFDIVFVLRCNNTTLYDRLVTRGYTEKKLRENVECEIFGTLVEEARDAYAAEIVHELASNTPDEMEVNVENIVNWVTQWRKDNA